MDEIMADSKWSKVHLVERPRGHRRGDWRLSGRVLGPLGGAVGAGIGKAVYDSKGEKLSELYIDSKVSDLKIERLPLRKAMPNDDDYMSYDCSNRKVKHETFQNRCGDGRIDTGLATTGGAGSGHKDTQVGALRDRCNASEFHPSNVVRGEGVDEHDGLPRPKAARPQLARQVRSRRT